jgi:hypothetical protein
MTQAQRMLLCAALTRAIKRACPLPSARTLPDELRILLTRLRQPRRQARTRRGDVGAVELDAEASHVHPR